jgi:DNA-binding MarR family transcriptional regulator
MNNSLVSPPLAPPEPHTLEEAGLAESMVESLLLKILYFRGDLYGRDLATAIGLRLSAIEHVVEALKLRHHLQIKRSLGMGNVGAVLSLTDAGRERAREALEANQYAGAAPVPLEQYRETVRRQRPADGWLSRGKLAKALSGMVLTEHLLSQIGPAVSSANSLLLYGKPGDGKTFLIESLNNLPTAPVFVPYAIESQGNIIQVYDPVYHERLDDEAESAALAVTNESAFDRRWVKCRRPFIVSGGELTLDMLDLRFNESSRIYEAPFQLKANNGIYLIDDFGRQRATPSEVLNRWIVPMERRIDYLRFMTGGKMTAPFEAFLVFSTNLKPADLGDEAFLRRIHYKMLLRGPAKNEFIRIFENFCKAKGLPCRPEVLDRFIDRCYWHTGKPFRRCHPRDVLTHALNLIKFEDLPMELTNELLERAFHSCFLEEEEGEAAAEVPIVRSQLQSCAEYWAERIAGIPTRMGVLAFLAASRENEQGVYRDATAERDYDPGEISAALREIHVRVFRDWLTMGLEQQRDDVSGYLADHEGRLLYECANGQELRSPLAPADTSDEELRLFRSDLAALLRVLGSRQVSLGAASRPELERLETAQCVR